MKNPTHKNTPPLVHKPLHQSPRTKTGGFTLIEVLITMAIFGIGIMGVSQITGNGIVSIADNNARAMALNIASQQLEPLYISAGTGNTTFKTALNNFVSGLDVLGNNNRDTYTITVLEAQDSSAIPINLITNNTPATWVSPLTVAMDISYTGRNGVSNTTISYTFITLLP